MKARNPLFIKTAAIIFSIFILCVIVFADLGYLRRPLYLMHKIPYGDKLGHFVLIGTLACLVIASAIQTRPDWNPNMTAIISALILAVIFSVEEASQVFFQDRHAGWKDLVANYAGIIAFGLFAWYTHKKRTS